SAVGTYSFMRTAPSGERLQELLRDERGLGRLVDWVRDRAAGVIAPARHGKREAPLLPARDDHDDLVRLLHQRHPLIVVAAVEPARPVAVVEVAVAAVEAQPAHLIV